MNIDLLVDRTYNWLLLLVVNPSSSSCPVLSSQFLTGLLLTVLTDIIHISVYYPLRGYPSDVKRFSMGMAIFSLLLKPGSCYFVYRMYRERGGDYMFNIGRVLPLHQCGPRPLLLGKAAGEDSVPFSLSLVQLDPAFLSKEEDGPSLPRVFSPFCAPAES